MVKKNNLVIEAIALSTLVVSYGAIATPAMAQVPTGIYQVTMTGRLPGGQPESLGTNCLRFKSNGVFSDDLFNFLAEQRVGTPTGVYGRTTVTPRRWQAQNMIVYSYNGTLSSSSLAADGIFSGVDDRGQFVPIYLTA